MPAPRRLLLLNVYFAPQSYGGATVVAESVARQLVERHDCEITVVSSMARHDLLPYTVMRTETAGIQNFAINLPGPLSYAERYDNPNLSGLVAQVLQDSAPELVHAHCMQNIGTGALRMARSQGLPVVLSVHDFWWLCEHQFMIRPSGAYCGQFPVRIENCVGCADKIGQARVRFSHLSETASSTNLITFPSQFARDLSVASGFPAGRSAIWENGVTLPEPDFFTAQAARRARDPRLVFGFVGGPSTIKGWPLIKAAFETLERGDFAGRLVDASLDGSWWGGIPLDRMQGDWTVVPRFDQSTMDAFYAQIDVLLFPSQWKETFGLTIREALARGIRVIQTDSGGTTEWAGADRSTMLKIGDGPEKLQARIRALLEGPPAHPAPRHVASYADQADAFMDLASALK